jgi:hypothetical protein
MIRALNSTITSRMMKMNLKISMLNKAIIDIASKKRGTTLARLKITAGKG